MMGCCLKSDSNVGLVGEKVNINSQYYLVLINEVRKVCLGSSPRFSDGAIKNTNIENEAIHH